MKRKSGVFDVDDSSGEKVLAFVPILLQSIDPKLKINRDLLGKANMYLEQLNLLGSLLPSVNMFVYGFVKKEALISSQIEGTQATLIDIFSQGLTGDEPNLNVEEVCNYISAFEYAQKQISKPKGLPISMRLLNEAHKKLMKGVRGKEKGPGKIRTTQNWIGGTRPGNAFYVPPQVTRLPDLLSDLEKYIHQYHKHPELIKIALIHYQFETIHPYLDGNGRIGRLLISLLLQEWKILKEPLLYISLYLKKHQKTYYDFLMYVRETGDYEKWVDFFLEGICNIAQESLQSIKKILLLVEGDRKKILHFKNNSMITLKIFEYLLRQPIVSSQLLVKQLKSTTPTINKSIQILEELNILKVNSERKRDRLYGYDQYIKLIDKEKI